MKKFAFLLCFLGLYLFSTAQIQVSKIVGKEGKDVKLGYGAFLKFSLPVSDADYATLEAGVNIFQSKAKPEYGWVNVPIKLGYLFTINRQGYGFYVEPQAGYNVFGISILDEKYTGAVLGAGAGYLFNFSNLKFDLGLRYEANLYPGGILNTLGLRFTYGINLGKKE